MSMDIMLPLCADFNDAHSPFQIDHFIIGESGETLWGMYQQALRELIARLQGASHKPMSPGQRAECVRFLAIAIAIKKQFGEITQERRDELDRDMWLARFKRMAALDLLSEYQITRGTWRVVLHVPQVFRADLVDTMINRPQELKNWLLESDSPWHLIKGEIDEEEASRLLDAGHDFDRVRASVAIHNNGTTQARRLTATRKDRHGN